MYGTNVRVHHGFPRHDYTAGTSNGADVSAPFAVECAATYAVLTYRIACPCFNPLIERTCFTHLDNTVAFRNGDEAIEQRLASGIIVRHFPDTHVPDRKMGFFNTFAHIHRFSNELCFVE